MDPTRRALCFPLSRGGRAREERGWWLRELVSDCNRRCGRVSARASATCSEPFCDLGAQLNMSRRFDARSALTATDVAAQAAIVGRGRRDAVPRSCVLLYVKTARSRERASYDAAANGPLRRAPTSARTVDDVIVSRPLAAAKRGSSRPAAKVQSPSASPSRGRPAGGAVARGPFRESVVFALRGARAGSGGGRPPGFASWRDSDDAICSRSRSTPLRGRRDPGPSPARRATSFHRGRRGPRAHVADAPPEDACSWDRLCGIQIFNPTSMCAGDPVLASVGGKVTDYFGAPLVYGGDASNALGVVASSPRGAAAHDAVCAAMRAAPEALSLLPGPVAGGDHAADVARDVAGAPLAPADLEALFPGRTLASFRAPEREAARGALSNGCRLRLTWADGGEGSVFYKRVVMAELPAAVKKQTTQPAKLLRDVESFRVEAAFLASAAASSFEGVRLPAALASTQVPDAAHPIDSRFALYLRDFAPEDGWRQRNLLAGDDARRTVRALAAFHARFWGADASSAGDVWPRGGHWLPEYAPDQFAAIASAWPRLLASFGAEFAAAAALDGVDLPTLGARLEAAAVAAAARAHPPADAPGRTLIHGDLKAANVFVSDDEVALIDFQFVGWGLAATDLAHFVCCAVDGGDLLDGGDAALVGAYKAALREALVGAGRAADDAAKILEGFDEQFDAGVVDIARLVFAYQWPRIDASPANLRAHAHVAARNSYNKNVDNAVWLVARADAALRRFAAPVKERTWPKWQDDLPSGGL
ncbi:inositol-1,4-bisphosphate 1-phosphatase [Aureococcus anophagefferens]|uniref:Inositol-1,4-bisphosphate 1-phosphatase n=1 Tax=Aureococcus anophagefferens TaxID=44056 RepID=A0ABR1FMS4_AURAN